MAGAYCKSCGRFTMFRQGPSKLRFCKCGYSTSNEDEHTNNSTPQFNKPEIDPLEEVRQAVLRKSQK